MEKDLNHLIKKDGKYMLIFIHVLAYLGMTGTAIEACGQLSAMVVSFWNPDFSKNMYYVNPAWMELRNIGIQHYIGIETLSVVLAILKVGIWVIGIQLLSKLNLKNPFSMEIAKKMSRLSQALFTIWILTIISNAYSELVMERTGVNISSEESTGEYMFLYAVVYIIYLVFRRGAQLQEENQLTV